MGRLRALWYSFRLCRTPGGDVDKLTRLVAASRLCVVPMTVYSVLIGAMLAWVFYDAVNLPVTVALLVGFTAAHLLDNLVNDYMDYRRGVDDWGYFRSLYGPHPFLEGVLDARDLAVVASLVAAYDGALALYLSWRSTPLIGLLAAVGVLVMASYAGVPFDAKRAGVGEILVAIVWGPVMAGGTLLALAGRHEPSLAAVYMPYAATVSLVLVGKHMDKYEHDKARGVGTLPVRLGLRAAGLLATAIAVAAPAALAAAVYALTDSQVALLALLPLPTAILLSNRVFTREKPSRPPEGWEAWPLWYVAAAYIVMDAVGRATLVTLATLGLQAAGHTTAALAVAALAVAWEALTLRRMASLTRVKGEIGMPSLRVA